jgi:hypothetical protein
VQNLLVRRANTSDAMQRCFLRYGISATEDKMRNAKWIVAAIGLVTMVAGCSVQDNRYPNTAQNQSRGNYWNSPNRDADRDGIPNRYDRDANGDGVPDRYQGRR